MQPAGAIYDEIGVGYGAVRREDPRIAAQIWRALGEAAPVLNVGAGAGSYEGDRAVVAVEPSPTMIGQRSLGAAPTVQALADDLPFGDRAFAGAMSILTVHHWPDAAAGLAEVRRVTRGPVAVLTFDHGVHLQQWLVTDYLPEIAALDRDLPTPQAIAGLLGGGRVEVVPVPHDCRDGFCHAWWRRPEAYLSPAVRAGISGIARLAGPIVDRAMAQLASDLADGTWRATHADLLDRTWIDGGYRLVVSPGG